MRVAMVTQVMECNFARNSITLIVNPAGSPFPIEGFVASLVFFSPGFRRNPLLRILQCANLASFRTATGRLRCAADEFR